MKRQEEYVRHDVGLNRVIWTGSDRGLEWFVTEWQGKDISRSTGVDSIE